MQRQQSQVQMETLTNLDAAQVPETTYDVRDFQTKAFSKMKGSKGDEKAWPDWRYKFSDLLQTSLPQIVKCSQVFCHGSEL